MSEGWAAFAKAASDIGGAVYNQEKSGSNLRKGHKADVRYSLKKERGLWAAARKRGATISEYYGSSAAGGGGGVSGGANVLGRSTEKTAQLMADAGGALADYQLTKRGQDIDLEKSKIQAQAQIKSAGIQQETGKYSADKSYEGVMEKLKFSKKVYNEITKPQAARIADKTTKEIEHLVNQVALSEPKFVRMLKIMTMGTDNTLGLAIQNTLGIDVSDVEQMQNLSPDKRRALIQGMMTAGSQTAKELSGTQTTISQYLDLFVDALEKAGQGISESFKPGIQRSQKDRKNLGRGRGYQ